LPGQASRGGRRPAAWAGPGASARRPPACVASWPSKGLRLRAGDGRIVAADRGCNCLGPPGGSFSGGGAGVSPGCQFCPSGSTRLLRSIERAAMLWGRRTTMSRAPDPPPPTEGPLHDWWDHPVRDLVRLRPPELPPGMKERHRLYSLLLMALVADYWNGNK